MKKIIGTILVVLGVLLCWKYGEALLRNITELIICNECSIVGQRLRMELENVSISVPLMLLLKRTILTAIGTILIVIGFPKNKEVNEEG